MDWILDQQQLYSEFPPNVRTPCPITKAEPSHPAEKANFGHYCHVLSGPY